MLGPGPGRSEGEPSAATLFQDRGCPAQRFARFLLLGDRHCPQPPAVPRSEGPGWVAECVHLAGGVWWLPARCLLGDPLLGLSSSGRSSSPASPVYSSSDTVTCRLTHTVPCAHQKPITALKAAAGRLVTGSQDHTLRVSRLHLLGAGWPATGDGGAFGGQPGRGCRRDFLAHV